VIDPFAGSCATGEACEITGRSWLCVEIEEECLKGAIGRFQATAKKVRATGKPDDPSNFYKVPRPGLLWQGIEIDKLPEDGGKRRPPHIGAGRKRSPRAQVEGTSKKPPKAKRKRRQTKELF
jgi:site-specific DNA-methyltransferase (cytosine-N4-specific)